MYIEVQKFLFVIGMVVPGAQKLARIRENSNFFRSELQKMGFEVLGDNDSPVMPIMLYNPAKIPAFSRECLRRNVSVMRFLDGLIMIDSGILKLQYVIFFFDESYIYVVRVLVSFPIL